MIWQEEERNKQRKREFWAFYAGCSVTLLVVGLIVFAVVQATGGIHGGCP